MEEIRDTYQKYEKVYLKTYWQTITLVLALMNKFQRYRVKACLQWLFIKQVAPRKRSKLLGWLRQKLYDFIQNKTRSGIQEFHRLTDGNSAAFDHIPKDNPE